jgi:hypothetical protein
MPNIYLNQAGFIHLSKKVKLGLKAPAERAVKLITFFVERTAKENTDKQIYSRSVPWRRTGKLKQSIIAQVMAAIGKVYVGVRYGRFVEFPTKPHKIKAKAGKKLRFFVDGKPKEVNHPGTKARPFFFPAIKEGKKQAPRIMKEQVDKQLSL